MSKKKEKKAVKEPKLNKKFAKNLASILPEIKDKNFKRIDRAITEEKRRRAGNSANQSTESL